MRFPPEKSDNAKRDLQRRLERAKFHLDDLANQVERFRSRDPYTAVSEPNRKGVGYVIKITSHEPVPPILGLIAADFVHNLRALLDNLIWTLAPDALRGSQKLAFPLFLTPTSFDRFTTTVLKGKLPLERVDALERHQPYNRRPDDVENDRLRILHKMWNADKHHAPTGVIYWAQAATAAAYGDRIKASDFGFQVGPLRRDRVVGWVSAEGTERDLHPRVSLVVAFKTRRPTLTVPRHALMKMYDIVATAVLPDLRQFL